MSTFLKRKSAHGVQLKLAYVRQDLACWRVAASFTKMQLLKTGKRMDLVCGIKNIKSNWNCTSYTEEEVSTNKNLFHQKK